MLVIMFILGLVLGSFYNVVGLRLPKGESIVFPSSHCLNCNHKLSWYENIPLLSFIFLKGKCRSCKEKISIIYPLIELLTGVLFALTYYIYGLNVNLLIGLILVSLVVVIFVSDSKYMIILDSPLVISSVLIFLIKLINEGVKSSLISVVHGLIVFLLVYFLMLFGNFIFKKESLGGGDIKLSFISGLVLGPYLGAFYIVLAAFLAFPYAIYITIKNKDNLLPFGPFLASSLLIIFYNQDVFINFFKTLFSL